MYISVIFRTINLFFSLLIHTCLEFLIFFLQLWKLSDSLSFKIMIYTNI